MFHLARAWVQSAWSFLPARSLQRLMAARVVLLYFLLVLAITHQIFQVAEDPQALVLAYGLLSFAYGITFLFSVFPQQWTEHRAIGLAHVAADSVLIGTWIAGVPGSQSITALLFLVQILLVALTLYQRAALEAASLACVVFGLALWGRESEFWTVWAIHSALFMAAGFVGGYLSEELHRTNQRLEEKSRRVEGLIELQQRILSRLPTGLVTVDEELRVGFINPAACHILSVDPDKVIGTGLRESLPGLVQFFTIAPDGARLQQVVELQVGASTRKLRGDVAPMGSAKAAEHLLHARAELGHVLLFQDVTAVLALEAQVKQNEKLAAVGQLAAGIAHEIRNPLAGMSASIEMLRSSLPKEHVSAEDSKLMDIALREIDRLNQLVSEFLDFVKPQQMKLENLQLAVLIEEVLGSLTTPKEPGRIKTLKGALSYRSDTMLMGKADPAVWVLANPMKLKQVVWNLVINALQAMDKPWAVEVGCRVVNDRTAMLWVSDQGQGMDSATLQHLYEPFFTTKEKGTGLGLATAYKIVEALKGEISVRSQPGIGTTFEICLPRAGSQGESA